MRADQLKRNRRASTIGFAIVGALLGLRGGHLWATTVMHREGYIEPAEAILFLTLGTVAGGGVGALIGRWLGSIVRARTTAIALGVAVFALGLSMAGSLGGEGSDWPTHLGGPRWSSDGTKIAFASDRGGDSDVYVMNADGTDVVRLTEDPGFDSFPDWSPDGTKIAFTRNRKGVSGIYVMNSNGTEVQRLTEGELDSAPTWSPDGTKLAFDASFRDVEILHIYVMDADGTGLVGLPDVRTPPQFAPAWSPDGTKIAFTRYRVDSTGRQSTDIYVMNADGTDVVRLTEDPAEDDFPDWSPDGTKIAFRSGRDGDIAIYVMNADGTDLVRLTDAGALG